MSLLGTVSAGEHETPELLAASREYLVVPRRRAFHAILATPQARGKLREAAGVGLAVNMLLGAYYAQYLPGSPFAEDWSERIMDAVLARLLPTA